jgi:hypothetical protein
MLSGGRNESAYPDCMTTAAIPAIGASGYSSPRIRDHCCAEFDRRLRRLLAGAVVVATPAAETCCNLPRDGAFRRLRKNPRTRDHCRAKFDRRLRRLLAGRVVIGTGAAVIEIGVAVIGNCGATASGISGDAGCRNMLRLDYYRSLQLPRGRTSLVFSVAYGLVAAQEPAAHGRRARTDHAPLRQSLQWLALRA